MNNYMRNLRAVMAILMLLGQAVRTGEVLAETDERSDDGAWRMSQAEVVLSATSFGAGMALMIASGFVEGKHDQVVGYRDVGGIPEPLTIEAGSNTKGMLVAGAALVFLGLCFVVSPVVGDSGEAIAASVDDHETDGFRLCAPSLDGRVAAVGVACGF